jgi:hypothetical protein
MLKTFQFRIQKSVSDSNFLFNFNVSQAQPTEPLLNFASVISVIRLFKFDISFTFLNYEICKKK